MTISDYWPSFWFDICESDDLTKEGLEADKIKGIFMHYFRKTNGKLVNCGPPPNFLIQLEVESEKWSNEGARTLDPDLGKTTEFNTTNTLAITACAKHPKKPIVTHRF